MLYFAYGSNLLTARIRARCPSARPAGLAVARGFRLAFAKPGADGSGKATLVASQRAAIQGVLYEIDRTEAPVLDRAETGYDRIDDFEIDDGAAPRRAMTYIAQTPKAGLAPYDWYLALMIAGAREHKLVDDYVGRLLTHPYESDIRNACRYRDAAHAALKSSGYDTVQSVMDGTA